ncbi:hypothetical protein BMAJHU_I0142, partial [Burkholderia mallei JHU]
RACPDDRHVRTTSSVACRPGR